MFHAGNGPNTSTGNNGIVVVVLDVDVDDVEESGDVVDVGPYGIDVVVVTPGTVEVVVVQSVVVVVDEDSGGSLDVGGSVSTGGSVVGGSVVGGGSVGGGSVGAGSVEGGAWDLAENAHAPGAGTRTAAVTRPASSLINERVARREIISRPAS